MAYQVLQGVQVSPKGNYNLKRFSKSLVGGTWPTSFAFGGWIYTAECDIGFSSQPTEIKLSIVLEVTDRAQKYAFFDIKDEDLKCGAGDGDDETWFDIDFNGVLFQNMYLYEKSISIENNAKVLNVTFKDYSIILDKIYIGLLKRQGNGFPHTENAVLGFPVICPDCQLTGGSLKQWSYANRNMAYGSYVGINGKTYDNFANIPSQGHIYRQWEAFFKAPITKPFFDLNGGYLIIGTEEATEERCGDLAPMSYNFNQLLASLRMRGMKFEGAFPRAISDADYIYHQNYMGSLREVMQQWCSDLGYDFYCKGKTFVGINLTHALDISKITNIADPTTELGSNFALSHGTAIISYKANTTLNNTFKQAVITQNNRPRNLKVSSKSPKRYVGILPLHPIDLNRHSQMPVIRFDAFGTWFYDVAWANNFEPNPMNYDRRKTLPELDGRNFGDIDTCICLTHYEPALRDLFCQDRALYGATPEIQAANFRALGFVPLVELQDEGKAMAIENAIPDGQDEISNVCRDKRFYRVFIGYSYPKFKEDILQWEQAAGEAMYKYGIVVKGPINSFPYFPQNTLKDLSPTSGLYGDAGQSLLRVQHNVEPNVSQYFAMRMAPFKDLILYSGLMTPTNIGLPMPLNFTGLFPTGLFYAELDNEWGTTLEVFKRAMTLNLVDPCVVQYGQELNYTDMTNNVPKRIQDWRLEDFTPKASSDLEKIWDFATTALQSISGVTALDRTVNIYYNYHHKLEETCSKLHVIVMTDTRNHPNIYFEFNPRETIFQNVVVLQQYQDKLRAAYRRRAEMKTPTVCDLTLIQEMCRNLLSGAFQAGPSGDPRFGCIQDEDKWNWLEDGFTYQYLNQANSRGLNIRIVKNPIRNDDTDLLAATFKGADANGDFYYSDVASQLLLYESKSLNYNLVYPVNTNSVGGPGGWYYRGVLTSQVDFENRTPEIVDIFGAPVNATNNNTATLKIINNVVEPDLQPQLDPYSMRFWSYMTVITGEASVITTAAQYHEFVKRLNNYELTQPMKTVELSLAGSPNDFGTLKNYLTPDFGLNKLTMNVSEQGMTTSLSFSDRPKVLPRQESILNKITPRMKK
jgi:hypothetical protein